MWVVAGAAVDAGVFDEGASPFIRGRGAGFGGRLVGGLETFAQAFL